jgi:hydrogenase expression/formation protein HypE
MGNEGKLVALVPAEQAEKALEAIRGAKYGQDACIVGYVNDKAPGKLHLRTRIGGLRNLEILQGEGLPRIC